jgi:hypothetical protein
LEKEELKRELGKAGNKVRIRKIKKAPMKIIHSPHSVD